MRNDEPRAPQDSPAIDAILRRLLPEEFAQDIVGDLREGYRRRWAAATGLRGRMAAAAWWARECMTIPYAGAWRQARRLRSAGARREMSLKRGGGVVSGMQLRIAARSLGRRPTHTVVAVATLVLGVGATTLAFSVLEGVLLRPLPYPASARLYAVFGTDTQLRDGQNDMLRATWDERLVSQAMVSSWRSSAPGAEALGAYLAGSARLDDGATPVEVPGAYVLRGFFTTLGLRPLLGRLPNAEELTSGAPVVVLAERLWASRYRRDRTVLGRTVSLDGVPSTVIGVMPAAFGVPSDQAVWWSPAPKGLTKSRDLTMFRAILRRAADVDAATVAAELVAGVQTLASSNPVYRGRGARVVPLRDEVVSGVRQGIVLLFWAVAMVMLIACVNLTSLVVARSARRRPELALRSALGAGRGSLVGATLGETVLLCAVGGGLGVLASVLLVHPLARFLVASVPSFPRASDIGIHPTVLLFALVLTASTALLSGALPACAASRRSPWEALQEGRRGAGGRGIRRTQRTLLFVEAGLAMILLVGAGLLLRSSLNVSSVDPGFDKNVAFVRVQPSPRRYRTTAEAQGVAERAATRIAALPGVQGVGRASALPGVGSTVLSLVWREGQPAADAATVAAVAVDPGYFATLRIPLFQGRAFDEADGAGAEPVAMVSRRLARQMFGTGRAVGRTLRTDAAAGGSHSDNTSVPVRIVGVVGDVRQVAMVVDANAVLYRPLAQTGTRQQVIVARSAGPAVGLVEAARRQILVEDPGLLTVDAGTLARAVLRPAAPLRTRTLLLGTLSGLAVLLMLVGIYGVVAYVVSDRTREIGIRMALGGRARDVSAHMVGVALWPVALGGLAGLAAAAALSGILGQELFAVGRLDPTTYATVLLVLTGMAVPAAWLPARRAATVDPMRVLTEE